ncbi:hypothetical protein NBO_6g0085 [Nosema bombycis CQ1]|jgi:hypothetical protein|uniref:Plectin/eS10 N-terminal domain-containing protein n=1 Tax=Nosema bombycis (strain CQ1 / CVCC 102059) TaxID=578461 RepID=R0KN81_NOSB1|nr:hypothetical protein NBO_1021g0001 [Nosema bombycis CQ1]EOB15334.1 hypothetical protein NBO_6g0085 [Nosema bombycis CQ1]|eukprot:EOB11607.1 hypothetical protein NBO_1021g0001 [Nosema bombycis CQ1]
MRLTSGEKFRVMKHLKNTGSLLIHDRPLDNHNILDIKIGPLRGFITSLKDRGFVEEFYVWNHSYVLTTDSGITWLNEELDIPDVIEEGQIIENVEQKAEIVN